MTVKEYKEKLRELHERIKENPFRRGYEVNIKYGKGYFDTVYKFAETFYHLTRDIRKDLLEDITEEDKKLAKVANDCLFIHDFYSCVNRSYNAISNYQDYGRESSLTAVYDEEELVELCISCVHCYIDTGFFNRYPFKYRRTIKWAEWNKEMNM